MDEGVFFWGGVLFVGWLVGWLVCLVGCLFVFLFVFSSDVFWFLFGSFPKAPLDTFVWGVKER